MAMHGALHPRADVSRIHVSRKEGGRGLQSIHDVVTMEKSNLERYVPQSDEELLKVAAPILWPHLDTPRGSAQVVKCRLQVEHLYTSWTVCQANCTTDQREHLELADKGWSQEDHRESDHRDTRPGLGN